MARRKKVEHDEYHYRRFSSVNEAHWRAFNLLILALSTDFIFAYSDALVFDLKPVRSISRAYESSIVREAIQKHPFHSLSYKQKRKLCSDAEKYASEKEIALKQVSTENAELNTFTIFEGPNKWGEDQIGLKCPTIPSILLAPSGKRNVVDRIDFMVEENPFLKYLFLEEIIAHFKRKVDIVAGNNFFNLNETEKWELCAAAKSSLDYHINMLTDNDWSEKVVGLFNVVYPNGIEVDFEVALECNSSPKMYLRDSGVPTNTDGTIFMIMLIENEINSASVHQEADEINFSSQENFVSASTCNGPDCV